MSPSPSLPVPLAPPAAAARPWPLAAGGRQAPAGRFDTRVRPPASTARGGSRRGGSSARFRPRRLKLERRLASRRRAGGPCRLQGASTARARGGSCRGCPAGYQKKRPLAVGPPLFRLGCRARGLATGLARRPDPAAIAANVLGRYALRFDVPGTEGRLEPWMLCALRKMVENRVFGPTPLRAAAAQPGDCRETGVEVDRRGPPPPPPPPHPAPPHAALGVSNDSPNLAPIHWSRRLR
jgi:hypothetical protein